MKKRPVGLTIFAVINFVFAGLMLLGLIGFIGVTLAGKSSAFKMTPYTVLSPALTAALLIISGVGFLRMSYRFGFIGGMAFCILSLGNVLVFNAMNGFEDFISHVPSLVYPILLLVMLLLRYRHSFSAAPSGQS